MTISYGLASVDLSTDEIAELLDIPVRVAESRLRGVASATVGQLARLLRRPEGRIREAIRAEAEARQEGGEI